MEGCVNGYEFTIEDEGIGNPYEQVSLKKQNILDYFITVHYKQENIKG